MDWFFKKLKGYRGVILAVSATGLLYLDSARELFVSVIEVVGVPLDEGAQGGAGLVALVLVVKTGYLKFFKKSDL